MQLDLEDVRKVSRQMTAYHFLQKVLQLNVLKQKPAETIVPTEVDSSTFDYGEV
jgi:hypothetical protein